MPVNVQVQGGQGTTLREWNMRCAEVIGNCMYESGARGLHARGEEVALVAFMVAPTGEYRMRDYRKKIKRTYMEVSPERGSFFLIFILPILISLISQWIAKWILNHTTGELMEMKSQAFDSLAASLPGSMDTLTSISSREQRPT